MLLDIVLDNRSHTQYICIENYEIVVDAFVENFYFLGNNPVYKKYVYINKNIH